MAVTPPTRGQQDWDDEMNNALQSLDSGVQAAAAQAAVAASDAAYARNRADEVHTAVLGGTDVAVAGFIDDDTSATKASLSATIAGQATPIAEAKSALARTGRGIETLTNGALVFIDDDGKAETYTKTRAIFNAKGKPFVAAVTTGLLDTANYMTLAQVQTLEAEGHEIASHLVSHGAVGPGSYDGIEASHEWLTANGFEVDHLVWVGGAYDTTAINRAKVLYRSATSVERGRNAQPINQFAIKRYAVGSMWNSATADGILENGSQAQYNAMVDLAKNNNALVVAMMHNWDPQFDTTQQTRLEAMLEYAVAQGVPILTMREALARFGNSLDLGVEANHVRVGADGKQSFKDSRGTLSQRDLGVNPTGISATTAGTTFPQGVTTTATFTTPSASGFPIAHAGTLVTHYLNDQFTIVQWWFPYSTDGTGGAYYRHWRGTAAAWGGWRAVVGVPTPTTTINVPAQSVAAGAVVEVRIAHPNASAISGTASSIVASPVGGLETGLIHAVSMWTDKTVVFRLYNPTGATVATAARNWRVSVFD